jgi:hypothetical protein
MRGRSLLIAALACALLAAAAASLMSQTRSAVGPAGPARFAPGSPTNPQPPLTPGAEYRDLTTYSFSTGLQNAWKMEETGAAKRIDAVSANDLTAVGAPPTVAGKSGNAASLSATRQLRTVADNPATATDLTIAGWFSTSEVAGTVYFLSLTESVTMSATFSGTCQVTLETRDPVTTAVVSSVSQPANPGHGSCAGWVLLTVRYTYAPKQWTLRTYGIGAGFDLLNYTPPAVATNQLPATAELCLNLKNCTNLPVNMAADEVTIWARYVPDAELDSFYNSGAGRFHPF